MYFVLPSEALNLSSPKVCELELKDNKNMIKKNLLVLDNLELDKIGSVFDLDYLFSLGFDSFLCNSKTSIFFKDETTERYYFQFENYRIFSVGFSEVLIRKIN